MRGKAAVLVTVNFERNLEAIADFLSSAEAGGAFDALLERLSTIIANLQRFPDLGADFLGRAPLSLDGKALYEQVVKSTGRDAQVRQLIDGEYILLYLVNGKSVYLLSTRHHRQLSFDLRAHWP
jgi:hypothetical protein